MAKKALSLFLILFLLAVFSSEKISAGMRFNVLNTVGKKKHGGFMVLTPSSQLGKPYVSGVTVIFDWRDFEPVEGQYRWELLTSLNATHISWKQYYDYFLCVDFRDDYCPAHPDDPNCNPPPQCGQPAPVFVPGKAFFDADAAKRTVRFKIRVTEGALPLWLYGGEDRNGVNPSSYGTLCAYKDADNIPDCNPQTDIALAILHYPLYPKAEDASEPVWWNPIFQEKLRTTLLAIGQRIESDPMLRQTIEFVEASVGSYGEMILYGKTETGITDGPSQKLFQAAGYTNAVYSEAVLKILGFYQEAFPHIPIALSLGNGLYSGPVDDGSGVNSVELKVTTEAMEKWGTRLYLKFAGFGGGLKGNTFRTYCPSLTKCIYESFGGITQWKLNEEPFPWGGDHSKLEQIFNYAVNDHASWIMMWDRDWDEIAKPENGEGSLEQAFADIAPKLGPQIWMDYGDTGVEFSSRNLPAGSPLTITTKLRNDSYVSLMRPKRFFNFSTNTIKEIPASFPFYFDLLNASGNVAFQTIYIPADGTHTWVKDRGQIVTNDQIFLPFNLPPGIYTPRIGIVLNDELTKFWRIGGRDSSEGDGPYPIASKKITITAPTPICPRSDKGNLDCDGGGVINNADLSLFLTAWSTGGPVPIPPSGKSTANLNSDEKVDESDLSLLLGNW